MTSTQSLHESEIVISFFSVLQLMIKSPNARRLIDWHVRFFDKDVAGIDPSSPLYIAASRMNEELALCKRRRRSRVRRYNMSDIDRVYNHYWINKSPATLCDAWDLFETGRYRTEV